MRNLSSPPILLAGAVAAILTGPDAVPLILVPACTAFLLLLPRGQQLLLLLLTGFTAGRMALPAGTPSAAGPRTIREAACLTDRVEGRVVSIRTNAGKRRIILQATRVHLVRTGTHHVQGRLLVFLPPSLPLPAFGSIARVRGETRPLPPSPDPFVPAAAIYRPHSLRTLPEPSPLYRLINRVRSLVRRLFRPSGRITPFLNAVFLGDRSGLDPAALRPFRRTGIAHVLAVSGFHVALLAGILALLTARLPKFAGLAIELPLLFFYTLLTGAGPSILRAALLFSLRRIFPGRHPFSALAACALFLLLVRPAILHSTAARLSFAASGGIILLSRRIAGLPPFSRLPAPIALSLAASLGAQLALVPLLASTFGEVSLIAPVANLLLIPLFLLCCLFAVPAALLAAAGWGLPLALNGSLFSLFEGIARAAGSLPFASVPVPHWNTVHTILWYGGFAGLVLLYRLFKRREKAGLGRELLATLPPGLLAGRERDEYICRSPDEEEATVDGADPGGIPARDPAVH